MSSDVNLKIGIAKSLMVGFFLTVVLITTAFLWLVLSVLQDEMAIMFQAMTLLAAVCWSVDFVVLVVFLALAELKRQDERASEDDDL